MAGIRKQLTARRVSLGFILLLAGTMFLSTYIPQEMSTSAEGMAQWRRGHQAILWLVDGAHLHRVYAQPWFAIIILCAAMSLGVSTRDQLAAAGKRRGAAGAGGLEIAGSVAEEELRIVARMLRYRPVKTGGEGRLKFVRNPWGYYGNALLHLGMVISICASLYVALTGKQGALLLVEGAATDNRQSWINAEQGIIATPLKLPGLVRLDRLTVGFDAKNQPVAVSSAISILSGGDNVDRLTATINGITNYHGMRIYHSTEYGDAFTLEFTDKAGDTHYEKIPIQQPAGLDLAGYGDFALAWSPYTLSAKYLADAEKRSMTSANPLLTLRLLDGQRELTRLSLTRGASGMLGGYRVRLIGVDKWSKLIFVDITGMPVIFAGFAIIMLGGIMHYIFSPRELIGIMEQNDRCRVYWKAPSFADFYVEERDRAAAALHKGEA
jgi:cytochrome c biogenesis protein